MGALFSTTVHSHIFFPPATPIEQFDTLPFFRLLRTADEQQLPVPCAVYLPPPSTTRPSSSRYIVFSHGNATDMVHMDKYARHLAAITYETVVMYDYIGYGAAAAAAAPTEDGCYASLAAVVHYLRADLRIDASDIFLVGQSLGTGVVVDYAATHSWPTPIMLISPYKSICRVVVDSSMPIDKFVSSAKMPRLLCPVKICHGDRDTVIDISHGKELYELTPWARRMDPVWLPGVGHNNILGALSPSHFRDMFRGASDIILKNRAERRQRRKKGET